MALQATSVTSYTLVDLIDRILDKGLVINADITVSLVGVELLGIKIKASIASFETAAKYGIEFPVGTNQNTAAWKEAKKIKEICPQCSMKVPLEELKRSGCPWCGWKSTALNLHARTGASARIRKKHQD